jgi:hypothetical protein
VRATAVPEPSASVREVPDSEALALLLDLMLEEPVMAPRRPGRSGHRWVTRVQELSRASYWSARPQEARRAW